MPIHCHHLLSFFLLCETSHCHIIKYKMTMCSCKNRLVYLRIGIVQIKNKFKKNITFKYIYSITPKIGALTTCLYKVIRINHAQDRSFNSMSLRNRTVGTRCSIYVIDIYVLRFSNMFLRNPTVGTRCSIYVIGRYVFLLYVTC